MENNEVKPEAQPKKKDPRIRILILGLAAALVIFFGYLILAPNLSTENAMVERTKATVSAKILGQISQIAVKEGDFVPRGTLLFQLSTAELQAQKAQAEANLLVAQAGIRLAQVGFERSQADFLRAKNQYTQQIISTEAFDHAEKSFEGARIDFELAQKKVTVAQAQLDYVNANLANARAEAPFDAVVARRWLNEGDILQPGQPVLTLFDKTRAWVTANFEETKIGRFRIGQEAEIRIDAYPGQVFKGKVMEIGVNTGNQFSLIPVNNAAGNFTKVTQRIPVKLSLDQSTDLQDPQARKLLPGMSAVVDVKP